MKRQHPAPRPVRLTPLVAVTLANYAVQVPYFLHNDHTASQLPGLRAVALLGATLAWFMLGLVGLAWRRRWGLAVLVSFLAAEAVFYAGSVATGALVFQMENHSILLKAIFIIGYTSGAVAAYYAFLLLRGRLGDGSSPGGEQALDGRRAAPTQNDAAAATQLRGTGSRPTGDCEASRCRQAG